MPGLSPPPLPSSEANSPRVERPLSEEEAAADSVFTEMYDAHKKVTDTVFVKDPLLGFATPVAPRQQTSPEQSVKLGAKGRAQDPKLGFDQLV